jgi:hypothetical protein
VLVYPSMSSVSDTLSLINRLIDPKGECSTEIMFSLRITWISLAISLTRLPIVSAKEERFFPQNYLDFT